MLTNKLIFILGASIAMTPLMSLANNAEEIAQRNKTDRTQLSNTIKEKLTNETNINNAHLSIHSYKDNVQICGYVNNSADKEKIKDVLRRTDGVSRYYDDVAVVDNISDNLRTNFNNPHNDTYLAQPKLANTVEQHLKAAHVLQNDDISITATKSVVTLCGFVKDPDTKERAVKLAKTTTGVKSVRNDLIDVSQLG